MSASGPIALEARGRIVGDTLGGTIFRIAGYALARSIPDAGTNQIVPSGGSVSSAENGCPCIGTFSAWTPKPLPTSAPA